MSGFSWLNFQNKTSPSEQKNGKQWDWGKNCFLIYCLPWERDGVIEEGRARGYKEMLSILADQWRPRIWAQMRRGRLRGLSQWVQLYTEAQSYQKYQKYKNGAASNQLTDQWKGRGCVLGSWQWICWCVTERGHCTLCWPQSNSVFT